MLILMGLVEVLQEIWTKTIIQLGECEHKKLVWQPLDFCAEFAWTQSTDLLPTLSGIGRVASLSQLLELEDLVL